MLLSQSPIVLPPTPLYIMNFTSFISLLALTFVGLFVQAAPLLTSRDVFVPPVLTPTTGDVWFVGQTYTVTWYV